MTDPYSVLGVNANATDDEVKRAYRELARKYHPDNYQNNPLADLAEEKMKEVNEAYELINKQRSGGGGYAYQQSSARQESGPRSGSGQGNFAQVRNYINAGQIDQAERLLQSIPQNNSGEWYFLAGSIAYRRGWLDEAAQNYNLAVQLSPANAEYRQAANMMNQGGAGYRPRQYSSGMDAMDCCTTMMCLNCLCDGGGC
ncbi:MAG: Chaperone protein DnaJ [Oscillospiraceae bacterium]|nr:Chaperone protein DnaJ [Oscillospiraceae bacterium]